MSERIIIYSRANLPKGMENVLAIADFNSRMAGNPRKIIDFTSQLFAYERTKHQLIETFTNQLYAYFLERKKQEEKYN